MKIQIIGLTCAITAAACGAAETQPAEAPSANSAASRPSENANAMPGTSSVVTTRTETAAVNPPSIAAGTTHAESSQVNAPVNDARDRGLTAMDQGNSKSETKITASIRKRIVADGTLSFSGKNVKVITVGNKVTLRGSVNNGQERTVIERLAHDTEGVLDVDNQLEVKP